jgi:hypothetical protein
MMVLLGPPIVIRVNPPGWAHAKPLHGLAQALCRSWNMCQKWNIPMKANTQSFASIKKGVMEGMRAAAGSRLWHTGTLGNCVTDRLKEDN